MKVFTCVVVLAMSLPHLHAQPKLLDQLVETIRSAPHIEQQKHNKIDSLKKRLAQIHFSNVLSQHQLYEKLYEAYKLFQYDSAYTYARKMRLVAGIMNDSSLINIARIKTGFSLLSSGMYKETLDTLSQVDLSKVSTKDSANFYALMGRYYYDLGDYANDQIHTPQYIHKGSAYLDSAISIFPGGSYEHIYYDGLKKLKTGDRDAASKNFETLLNRNDLTSHQVAITASTLSHLRILEDRNGDAINLLAKATMADIQSSTKETSAAYVLATLLYKEGDIQHASLCINQAFSDAVFYGARQRKMQVTAILPLIEAQKLSIAESQKVTLLWYAVLVTLLLIVVLALIIFILRQVRNLKKAQAAITEAHEQAQEANRRLLEANEKLNDANKIKEEYIGYFFNVNAQFFDRMEHLKKSIEQKINDRKLDDIRFLVNNINVKKEKDDLLRHFDTAFLKLFPKFVTEFNELFKPEDRTVLKEGELLNTDLRIFALARVGIHENEKIAHILQYSVNTINTYKTRIKNKSTVPNEEFEKRIMRIKTS